MLKTFIFGILEGDEVQDFFNFFVNPLIWPFYSGLAMYGFAWIGARFFAGVFSRRMKGDPRAIERGTIQAWRLVIILHLLLETTFVIGLSVYALPRVADWMHIFWYLISYMPFLIIDVCLLISLASHSAKKK